MGRWQFSIAGMMGLVVVAGVGIAALRYPSANWAGVLFTVALGVVLTAVLGAVARRGPGRLAWVGMATFGGTYLVLSLWLIPWLHDDPLRPPYLASEALEALHPAIGPQAPPPAAPGATFGLGGGGGGGMGGGGAGGMGSFVPQD